MTNIFLPRSPPGPLPSSDQKQQKSNMCEHRDINYTQVSLNATAQKAGIIKFVPVQS